MHATDSGTSEQGTAAMKIGLYSVTYRGIWYDGPALSFDGKAMA